MQEPIEGYQPRRRSSQFIRHPAFNLLLLIFTIGSTWLVGGSWYSFSMIVILFAHEMGHYFMCRRYHIRATLPFFIPFPFPSMNPFGTLGAVIKMKDRIPNRRALFDIGIAGPLAGLFFTLPALVFGLKFSEIVEVSQLPTNTLILGESLLFSQLSRLIVGNLPEGHELLLHPMAFAGWAGLFVTSLNLLPIGQLDGGHLVYALFGRKSSKIYKLILAAFIFICAIWYPGWLLFILLLIWIGYLHPAPIDDSISLNAKRRFIGYFTFALFLISFTPIPFRF